MSNKNSSVSSSGVGVSGLLWVALIVLKVLGLIQWSWVAVITGFLWIPVLVYGAWMLVLLLLSGVALLFLTLRSKK